MQDFQLGLQTENEANDPILTSLARPIKDH